MTRIIAALACIAALADSLPARAERPQLVIATGVDPSFSAYFVAQEGGRAQLVTATNVFAHIEDVGEVIGADVGAGVRVRRTNNRLRIESDGQ